MLRIRIDIWLWSYLEQSFQYGFRIISIFFFFVKYDVVEDWNNILFTIFAPNSLKSHNMMDADVLQPLLQLLSSTFFHIAHFAVDFVSIFPIRTTICMLFKWKCVARASAIYYY